MTPAWKASLLALALVTAVGGCSLDGDDGAAGAPGAEGPAGPAGPQGPQGPGGSNGADGSDGQNAQLGVSATLIGRHASGVYGAGAAEIVQFHAASNRILVVNGAAGRVDLVDASALTSDAVSDPLVANNLSSTPLNLPASVTIGNATLALGGANSIAINGDLLAVAVEAEVKQDAGAVLFYDISGEPTFISAVAVGALPDMVTFTPDGSKLLVAGEGEPNADYTVDPSGTVAIITITNGQPAATATLLDFTAFEGQRAALLAAGAKFASPVGTTIAQDLEPEYIAVSSDSRTAWVTLQENNALAIVDLTTPTITTVKALGIKDWGVAGNELDVSNRDGVNIRNWPGVYGLYQPDTIASYSWNGATFLVTANEGDARDYDGYSEESRVSGLTLSADFPSLADYSANGLGRLNVTTALGDDDNDGEYERLFAYGARSFSIWDGGGRLVWDSGSQLERIAAALYGDSFNSNHLEGLSGDNRSDDKGIEPEALAVGQVGQRTYAFIGAERMSNIYIFDITNPFAPTFVEVVINRDLDADYAIDDDSSPAEVEGDYAIAGDLGPEGMVLVPAANSPTGSALLLVGNEVSGTTTVYAINPR